MNFEQDLQTAAEESVSSPVLKSNKTIAAALAALAITGVAVTPRAPFIGVPVTLTAAAFALSTRRNLARDFQKGASAALGTLIVCGYGSVVIKNIVDPSHLPLYIRDKIVAAPLEFGRDFTVTSIFGKTYDAKLLPVAKPASKNRCNVIDISYSYKNYFGALESTTVSIPAPISSTSKRNADCALSQLAPR